MTGSKQCEGYTISGQQCRRRVPHGQRYCSTHSRAAEIGLPPYVNVTPTDSFWIFLPIGRPRWKVGSATKVSFKCLANNTEYAIDRYVSEGTYGAVYIGSRPDGSRVAVKVCKELYRHRRRDAAQNDFVREYFMHNVIRDRIRAPCVVNMVDAFFLKTEAGLHGCIAMDRMDGNLSELFKTFDAYPTCAEVLRFWIFCCNFIAGALVHLHANDVFHLDIKPANVLWRRARGGEKGRGISLRLVDLGLGCYLKRTGSEPHITCEATGTYLPLEWRRNGDKSTPTYEEIDDPRVLQMGDTYALCVTCLKLFAHVCPNLYARNPGISRFCELVNRGTQDDIGTRSTVSARTIERASASILADLDAAMPADMDESLRQIIPSSFYNVL